MQAVGISGLEDPRARKMGSLQLSYMLSYINLVGSNRWPNDLQNDGGKAARKIHGVREETVLEDLLEPSTEKLGC